MSLEEASYRLLSAPEEDIARSYDGTAMGERIMDWLDTPEGTVAHDPSWGHNLGKFKHDPLSKGNGLETLIEMAIARKITLDIEDLRLVGVKVEVLDIDLFRLVVIHQFGADSLQVKL